MLNYNFKDHTSEAVRIFGIAQSMMSAEQMTALTEGDMAHSMALSHESDRLGRDLSPEEEEVITAGFMQSHPQYASAVYKLNFYIAQVSHHRSVS